MQLDLNTFVIANKKYPRANLAQWAANGYARGTYDVRIHPDQLWLLVENPNHRGFYTINNAKWEGYRLAVWGGGNEDVIVYNGVYYTDQWWGFEHVGGDYIYFINT